MTRDGLPEPTRLRGRDALGLGLAGVRGRPGRAVLSALGVAIGVAALVAVLAIGTAGQAGLADQLQRLGTNLLTVTSGQSLTGGRAELPEEAIGMISRVAGVTSVTGVGVVPGATARRTDLIDPRVTGGIAVQAARLDLLDAVGGTVGSGAWLNAATARYPAVVLGAVSAARLGIDRAGRRVYISGGWWTVTGVLDPLPLFPDLDRSALIGWPAAERALGFDGRPTTLHVRAADPMVARVASVLAATTDPRHPEQVTVTRPSDALTARLAAMSTFTALFLGLGAVALVVGGVGIANIMVISVLERRQEIGLRRALGATRAHIRVQFLTESVTLALLGGLAGVTLGLTIGLAYAAYQEWPLLLPWQALLTGVLSALTLGTTAGLYPAHRAARLTPTQALTTG
ncbi:ABC transporter permease [Spongiactinospora sp. TRM90649]|uniref:ABC transporter permease n=1 Tax=Spongiactinospora sp. TRM90649 TaxID=3031114 RepID=UPI0023F618DF|nr:ABC transporter permease [Spongiactinospora sp. TRM90649]MDF5756195.1 ABC transporter permease [Spongiactinospora sp. TRM90649]